MVEWAKLLEPENRMKILSNVSMFLRPALTLYYLFTMSFRLAFRYSVEYERKFWVYLLLDYMVDVFFWADFMSEIWTEFQVTKVGPNLLDLAGVEMTKADEQLKNRRMRQIEAKTKSPSHSFEEKKELVSCPKVHPTETAPDSPTSSSRNAVPKRAELERSYSGVDKRAQFNAFEDLLSSFERKCKEEEILENIKSRTDEPNKLLGHLHKAMQFTMMFPFEIIAFAAGYEFYFVLRVFRLSRLVMIPSYFSAITGILETTNLMKGASARRVLYLTVFMMVFAHIGACCFYALAVHLLEQDTPVTDVWLSFDGIAVVSDDGSYVMTQSLQYRYIRALYWATVTSQTVGFGDVRPRSIHETSFCFFYFYCSHILAQLAIGNLILLVNVYDTARTKYTGQMAQLEKYSNFRGLPVELKDRISSFYYHQWKVLNGLDETQFLQELPRNIEIKVRQATVRNCLKSIRLLRKFKVSVMNALAEDAKVIMYSPDDVIVAAGSQSLGVYIVSRGEAFVHSAAAHRSHSEDMDAEGEVSGEYSTEQGGDDVVITQSLMQGDVFGEQGLSEKYEYHVSLISGAGVCEIIFLSRSRFKRTCRIFFNDAEYHKLVPSNPGRRGTAIDASKDQNGKKKYKMARKSHAKIRTTDLNVELGTFAKLGALLKPEEFIRTCWDVVIFVGIVYYSLTIPLELSNSFSRNVFEKHFELFLVGFFVDALFFVDLICRMFVFPVFKYSILISTPLQIFQIFKQSHFLILEIICVIPWDVIAIVNPNYLPALRLAKLFHLRKFTTYMAKSEKAMNNYLNISFSFAVSRFIKLYIALFELCHWVACLWLFTADYSTRKVNYDTNWKTQDRDTDFLSINYDGTLNGPTAYKRAIYWAINSMATSGVADMPSSNVTEMLVCCFTLLCGCQTINALLGSIASMMTNINTSKRDFANKMIVVSKYMKFKRFPPKLQKRIQFFYEYSFMRTSGANEMQVLAGLPQPLKEDVVKFVAGSVLVKIPFFANCIEPMLEMILGLLTSRLFLSGDDVVIAGEHGKEFFIIEGGTILVTSADKRTVYAKLGNGDYIGESCLLKVAKRTASAHAQDYSDTYVLQKEDFEKAVDAFPGDSSIVVDCINEILDAKARKNAIIASKIQARENSSSSLRKQDTEDSFRMRGDTPADRMSSGSSSTMLIARMETTMVGDTPMYKPSQSVDTHERWGYSFTWKNFIEDGSYARRCWESFLLLVVLYNMVMIPFRIAIENGEISPYLYILDYFFDAVLLVDSYLKAMWVQRVVHGRKVINRDDIWTNYKIYELKNDFATRFPWDLIALAFMGNSTYTPYFVLSFLRLPKVLLMMNGLDYIGAAESVLEELQISFFALRMLQVLLYCLLVGHWLGCGLYLFSKKNLGEFCVDDTSPDAIFSGNCHFRDTWVQFQIYTAKLPNSGGSSLSRYLRTVNWAIPTMVLYVVGDVYPMNASETSYMFGAMFFGIAINAMIIGTIIALVSAVDDVSADILMKSDTLREHLMANHVDPDLICKVSDYIKFMLSETGQILATENDIYKDLPHSLQMSVSRHLKLRFLKDCIFFDFLTDEVIRNLCMTMIHQVYYTGDFIISYGDLGQEMYFIESGSCEVLSADNNIVFAKLTRGSFFGETGLVFKSRRTANIRASSLCVCYILNKDQLDRELSDCDFDAAATIKNLTRLQASNANRNDALSQNMKLAMVEGSKLNNMLGNVTETPKEKVWLVFIEETGGFKLLVDFVGYFLLLYYTFVIPFEIAFLFEDIGEYKTLIAVDGVVDFLCIVEILLRLFVFPHGFKRIKSLEIKSAYLYVTLFDAVFDILSAIPLELLVFVPSIGFSNFFDLRLIHLLRLAGTFVRNEQIGKHLIRLGMTLQFTTIAVIKGFLAYVVVNHWMACMYFAVHRYMEGNVYNTWVVSDGYATFNEDTGRHNICNKSVMECYQRSMYFCGTVLTSVGYGDIAPITDIEMIFQVFLAVVGASMGANICGQMSSYLKLSDQSGEMAFKEKLRSVEHYCDYRNLNADLRIAIMANYRTMWRKERRAGAKETSFLHSLSTEMAGAVALQLNLPIIDVISVFTNCRQALHKRVALALKPQILLPDTPIYSEMDNGWCIFFILIGKVTVYPTKEVEGFDSVSKACLSILERKHKYLRHFHCTGHHFGEFCLTSKLGLRLENAHAVELTESYSLDKEDLWIVFQRMPFQERYAFLLTLFTDVGGFAFITGIIPSQHLQSLFSGESIKNLYRTVLAVVEDIYESFEEGVSEEEESDCESSCSEGRRQDTTYYRVRNMSMASDDTASEECEDRVDEQSPSFSKWTQALQAHTRSTLRRNSSRFLKHEMIYRKQSTGSRVFATPPRIHRADDECKKGDAADAYMGEVEERISALFQYIDKDGSGSINRSELMVSLLDLGIEKTWDEIDQMISFADVDGDSQVDIGELVKAIMVEIKEEANQPKEDNKDLDSEQADGEDFSNDPIKPNSSTRPSSLFVDLTKLVKKNSSGMVGTEIMDASSHDHDDCKSVVDVAAVAEADAETETVSL